MWKKLSSTVVIVAVSGIGTKAAHADDPNHPNGNFDLLAQCPSQMDSLPTDKFILDGSDQTGDAYVVPAAFGNPSLDCWNWAWSEISSVSFGTGATLVKPYGVNPFRPARNAWDCSHSEIEYGVYVQFPSPSPEQTAYNNSWQFWGGGQLWGNYVNGTCWYSVKNFPSGWGSDSVAVPAGTEVRIATMTWSHDDATIGHSGTDCSDPINCYWPTWMVADK
jgi:hypothetical protein